MEKETYETFEFIAPNSPNSAEIGPLFVLQEDGTILSVNREIQYVTHTEDRKQNVEPCAVFDVSSSSQRYYVDVNNETELIAVPDQYGTPTDEDNINSYLLQPEPTAVSEQMETDVLIESNTETLETDIDSASISKSVHTGFTEITLNNDQYQMLEQKGWILLECYDKIFVLNTLGLHDITENEKLVAKLKSEVQAFNVTTQLEELNDNKDVKIEDHPPDLQEVEIEDLVKLEKTENHEIQPLEVQSQMEDNSVRNLTGPDTAMNIENENVECNSTESSKDTQVVKKEESRKEEEEISSPIPDEYESNTCNTLKIKTKYIFTDVPHKIYLGKTTTGKKLFAKITKSKLNRIKNYKNLIFNEKKAENYCTLTESQFISIVQDSLHDATDKENVIEAEAVMMQLLKISQIKESIMGHKIILTKISISTDAEGKTTNQQRPVIITGIINKTDDGRGNFEYLPNMLQDLPVPEEKPEMEQYMDYEPYYDKRILNRMIDIFHIHVAESRTYDKQPNQTIQITKRKLSPDVLYDAKKRHPDPVYACGACAALFKSENTLKEHQENKCFAEDALTIDTDKFNVFTEAYTTIEAGKKKLYTCTLCEAKFTRLFNCQQHIKTHDIPNQNSDSDNGNGTETENKNPKKVYKCSMCSSTYFHPSTLSKHIVKMHIHV